MIAMVPGRGVSLISCLATRRFRDVQSVAPGLFPSGISPATFTTALSIQPRHASVSSSFRSGADQLADLDRRDHLGSLGPEVGADAHDDLRRRPGDSHVLKCAGSVIQGVDAGLSADLCGSGTSSATSFPFSHLTLSSSANQNDPTNRQAAETTERTRQSVSQSVSHRLGIRDFGSRLAFGYTSPSSDGDSCAR